MTSRRLRSVAAVTACAILAGCAASPVAGALPRPVAEFVERAQACYHWGGEEPSDAERARQIAAAATRLRCEALGDAAITLTARWPARADVGQAVDEVMALQ